MNIYEVIASEYTTIFPSSLQKVEFVKTYLKEGETLSILDVGCASGEFVYQLASPERTLLGIDLDPIMIKEAQKRHSPNILFKQADMMRFLQESKGNTFDLISCLGNTIVYLKDNDDLYTYLEAALRVLKKGGRLIIQTLNYSRFDIKEGFHFPSIESERIRFDRYYTLNEDGSTLDFHTSARDKKTNETFTDTHHHVPFLSSVIAEVADKVGFTNVEVFGSYDKKKVEVSDFFHLIVAEKL